MPELEVDVRWPRAELAALRVSSRSHEVSLMALEGPIRCLKRDTPTDRVEEMEQLVRETPHHVAQMDVGAWDSVGPIERIHQQLDESDQPVPAADDGVRGRSHGAARMLGRISDAPIESRKSVFGLRARFMDAGKSLTELRQSLAECQNRSSRFENHSFDCGVESSNYANHPASCGKGLRHRVERMAREAPMLAPQRSQKRT